MAKDRTVYVCEARELAQPPDIDRFQRECEALLAQSSQPVFAIHFKRLEFATSSFFASLVVLQQRCRAEDRELVLVGLRGNVLNAFKASRLDAMFTCVDSIEALDDAPI